MKTSDKNHDDPIDQDEHVKQALSFSQTENKNNERPIIYYLFLT